MAARWPSRAERRYVDNERRLSVCECGACPGRVGGSRASRPRTVANRIRASGSYWPPGKPAALEENYFPTTTTTVEMLPPHGAATQWVGPPYAWRRNADAPPARSRFRRPYERLKTRFNIVFNESRKLYSPL